MNKILILAQTPPPFHGQSIMQKYLVDCDWSWCEKKHIRLDFSKNIEQVGKFNLSKVFNLIKIIFLVWQERLKGSIDILYYPPCSANKIPFYRDVFILLFIRPFIKKLVFHFHAGSFNQLLNILSWWEIILAKLIYGRSDLSIVLFSSAKYEIEWIKPKLIVTIPNGLEDHSEDVRTTEVREQISVLYVGNLIPEKGIMNLVQACSLIKENIVVNVIGAWDSELFKNEVNNKINSLSLTDVFQFHGILTGKEKYLHFKKANIFCFPTYYSTEMNPLVLLEAMMFSLPIVTTNWRYLPEMFNDGIDGFLVPPNRPDVLAEKLSTLINSQSLREEFGKRAREKYLENFILSKHLERMENSFKQLI